MNKPPSLRPLSIKVIVAWEMLTGLAMGLALIGGRQPVIIFGFRTVGWTAVASGLLLLALQFYVAVGLWRLSELARRIAIGYFTYGFVNLTISHLTGQSTSGSSLRQEGAGPIWWCLTLALTGVACGLPIWFLIKRKAVFGKPTISPQA